MAQHVHGWQAAMHDSEHHANAQLWTVSEHVQSLTGTSAGRLQVEWLLNGDHGNLSAAFGHGHLDSSGAGSAQDSVAGLGGIPDAVQGETLVGPPVELGGKDSELGSEVPNVIDASLKVLRKEAQDIRDQGDKRATRHPAGGSRESDERCLDACLLSMR